MRSMWIVPEYKFYSLIKNRVNTKGLVLYFPFYIYQKFSMGSRVMSIPLYYHVLCFKLIHITFTIIYIEKKNHNNQYWAYCIYVYILSGKTSYIDHMVDYPPLIAFNKQRIQQKIHFSTDNLNMWIIYKISRCNWLPKNRINTRFSFSWDE